MEYAILELNKIVECYSNIKGGEHLKQEYEKSVDALKNGYRRKASQEVIEHIRSCIHSINRGLKNWGDNYLEEKSRQRRKKKQLWRAYEMLVSDPFPTLFENK